MEIEWCWIIRSLSAPTIGYYLIAVSLKFKRWRYLAG